MKKNLFIILLLSVVSVAVSAKESKKDSRYTKPEEAAAVCHTNLKEEIDNDAKHGGKTIKKAMGSQKIKAPKEAKFTYKKDFTSSNGQVDKTGKNEMLQFPFEGNLTITDTKAQEKSKYLVKGSFNVSKKTTKDKKSKEISETYSPAKKQPAVNLTLVPYFESEAQKKAKDLVLEYYSSHPEFVNPTIQKVEPCEVGYKVTTTRTLYYDAQKYTGDEGTVIFTIQKDPEQLDKFIRLEQTESHLTPFDNTPAPVEPVVEETEQETASKSKRVSLEDVEQISVSGFKFNSVALSDENKEQLDQAAQILLLYSEAEIELLGHSCDLGDKETNYNFGIMRAKVAKEYLVSKGVDAKRIYVHSYGSKKPLVSNTTAENRAQNRRVEIKVIK